MGTCARKIPWAPVSDPSPVLRSIWTNSPRGDAEMQGLVELCPIGEVLLGDAPAVLAATRLNGPGLGRKERRAIPQGG